MPSPRRDVQQRHERFHVQLFIDALNKRHRSNFRVVSEPNPPEAIIQSGRTTRWVEVVSAYWNRAYAQDLNSYATEGEVHKSVGSGVFRNMDLEFAQNFADSVLSKLEKSSYDSARDKYGAGYLVVPILFPFFGRDTLQFMQQEWRNKSVKDRGCFRSIYLNYKVSNTYAVSLWRPESEA